MTEWRATERLVVRKADVVAGTLVRTEHGARFEYAHEYVERNAGDALRAVAITLPVRSAPHDVAGVNVHPFFAGLLPEGLHLRALVRRTKTSEDDLFTLLAAAGRDTVGDVTAERPGTDSSGDDASLAPSIEVRVLGQSSFAELLERSLAGRDPATVAGVQPKVSAGKVSFPVRTSSARRLYVLKLAQGDYPRLVENESFCMRLAHAVGIEAARTELVHDREGRAGLLVERFDRVPIQLAAGARPTGVEAFERLHQEDLCQLLGRYPADKYRLTVADIARALELATAPLVERLRLLELYAFSYLIANGDLHAKNISLLVQAGRVRLSPAYDLVSTLPYGDDRMALALDDRDKRLCRAQFVEFGARHGVRTVATERMLTRLVTRARKHLGDLTVIGFDACSSRHLEREIHARLAALE